MASKFQNRLVGTLILVALGVILLPSLLDGKKKQYEEKFASIPLLPNSGDEQEIDLLPPVTQPLPVEVGNLAALEGSAHQGEGNRGGVPPAASREVAAVTDNALNSQTSSIEQKQPPLDKPSEQPQKNQQPVLAGTPPAQTQRQETQLAQSQRQETPPSGQAYVIQLGALKNAMKVEEIVARLRLSGYTVYTLPSRPVAEKLTRIYVGPDASRQKLEEQLDELKQLSGLAGQVRSYRP